MNLDVDVFDAEQFHKEVAQVECFRCTCVDGVELNFRAAECYCFLCSAALGHCRAQYCDDEASC